MNDILKFYFAAMLISNVVVGMVAYFVSPDHIMRHLGIFNFFVVASMIVNFLFYGQNRGD